MQSQTHSINPRQEERNRSSLLWPLSVGLFIGVSVAWFFLPVSQWLEVSIAWFRADPVLGPLTYSVFIIVSAVLLVPSTIPTVAAGSIWGLFWGALLLHVVSVIADMTCFLIARRYMRTGFKHRCLDKYPKLRAVDDALKENGFFLTVLMRWCPIVPINVMNYLLGMTSLSTRQFFWATALGTIPNSLIFVYLGTLVVDGHQIGISADPWTLVGGLTLCTFSVIGLTAYAKDKLRLHHAEVWNDDQGMAGLPNLAWNVCDDLDEVPTKIWSLDRLPKNLDRAYLHGISTADQAIDWHYCWLTHEDTVHVFAVFQSLELAPDRSLQVLKSGLIYRMLGWIFKRSNTRALICGNSFMSGVEGWWSSLEIGQEQLEGALYRLASELSHSHRGDTALLVFKDLRQAMSSTAMGARGYRAYDIDPCMEVHVDPAWQNIGGYQDALRTKYRKRYLKTRRKSAHLLRRGLDSRELKSLSSELYGLYENVLERASFCPVKYTPETFHALAHLLGPEYETIGYFDGNQLVAFNTRWKVGDILYSHFFGIDRAVAEKAELYKNIIFDDLEAAIDHGCLILHLGRGAQETKSEIGAVAVSSPLVARHRNFVGQLLWRLVTPLVKAPKWKHRNPMAHRERIQSSN
jgi:uncharacterized membrane protein YdjX (TVP38/TMEM64 family)